MAAPSPPALTHLYTCTAELGQPILVGGGPRGKRAVIPITGGSFEGPKLSGKVLPVGADWSLTDDKGTFSPDTRYQLETDDGAHIFIRTSGSAVQGKGCAFLRAIFETGSEKYYWLNHAVVVGILKHTPGKVDIDMWEMGMPEGQAPSEPAASV